VDDASRICRPSWRIKFQIELADKIEFFKSTATWNALGWDQSETCFYWQHSANKTVIRVHCDSLEVANREALSNEITVRRGSGETTREVQIGEAPAILASCRSLGSEAQDGSAVGSRWIAGGSGCVSRWTWRISFGCSRCCGRPDGKPGPPCKYMRQ
jgi:hypothetical protein